MTKPTPPPGDQQGFPPMVWRIVSEFGVLWKWTSCKDEADRQENYGRMAVPYVPESLLSEAVRVAERLRHHLEMLLPECSCYRAIGMCERCRILEGAKAASTEGGNG